MKWTNARSAAVKLEQKKGKRIVHDKDRVAMLLDRIIVYEDKIQQQAGDRIARAAEMNARLDVPASRTWKLLTPPGTTLGGESLNTSISLN